MARMTGAGTAPGQRPKGADDSSPEVPEVLLFNMPFVSVARPAMGLSLLMSRLTEAGIACEVAYANMRFAEWCGIDIYQLIDDEVGLSYFAGDWIFAQWLFGGTAEREAYLEGLSARVSEPDDVERITGLVGMVPEFLNACIEGFRVEERRLIGFSTTFQQNLTSLSLAKRIKELYPDKPIVFGGANCEGPMGRALHESFAWIDYVFDGESDETFPAFVAALFGGMPLDGLAGFHRRTEDGLSLPATPSPPIVDMDGLPDPDFKDYFHELEVSPLRERISPALMIETARGCWWGAKHHCTFCGLNGSSMAFRSKSPERVLAELERQQTRWNVDLFMAVDNILDQSYFKTLLPELSQRQSGAKIFYEIKANLKRAQVKLLSEAGVYMVQPGVESLSSHVLRLMRKGVTGLQNVQMLKWCRDYGVEPAWNLLYGFPGETWEDYAQTAQWIDALTHLPPPHAIGRVRLDRFSPYFTDPAAWGISGVRPASVYRCIYDLPEERLTELAYFFEFDFPGGCEPDIVSAEARRKAGLWRDSAGGDLRLAFDEEGRLLITDTRCEPALRFVLEGAQKEIYLACDHACPKHTLRGLARDALGEGSKRWLDGLLTEFIKNRLMIQEDDRYLSLAVADDPDALEAALREQRDARPRHVAA